jgi:HAMP domain-containing protein
MLFVRYAIVRPVKRLTDASHEISVGHPANLGVGRIARNSRNEIHQLALAIDRLRRSVNIAMRKLGEDAPGHAAPVEARHDR